MREDDLQYCTKHHTSYVTECHSCYREKTECIHGVPFDSECVECEEDAMLVKAGRERSCKEKLDNSHPLKNPESSHYDLWSGLEAIEVLEAVMTKEELIGWCKGNILKYRLRVGRKDEPLKELKKIETYENYLKYLEKFQ